MIKMPPVYVIIAAAAAAVIIILLLVWLIRALVFRPSKNKRLQCARLNSLLEPSGFAYEPKGDYFYSLMNCWQRRVGYCRLYDETAPLFNMVMHCEPIAFAYGGKRWLIELWKGQYGITTGAEIGVYNTARADVTSEQFTGPFYENIQDSELLDLAFIVRRNDKVLIKRQAKHWWLTGFVLGAFTEPEALTMEAHIKFPDPAMLDAFVRALRAAGYQPHEFEYQSTAVTIFFNRPHTEQPVSQTGVQRGIAQGLNQTNCALYQTATMPYTDTLDRLEFLQSMAPELFEFMLGSLYAKGVFEAFEWLLPILPPPLPPKPPRPPRPACEPCPCRPCARCGRVEVCCPCCSCCSCCASNPCRTCGACGGCCTCNVRCADDGCDICCSGNRRET